MFTKPFQPQRLFGRVLLGALSATLLWVAGLPCAMADSMPDDCHAPRTCLECGPATHCTSAVTVDCELPDLGPGATAPALDHAPAATILRRYAPDTRLRLPVRFDYGPPPPALRLHLRYSVLLI